MPNPLPGPRLADAVWSRTADLVAALSPADPSVLRGPSTLLGWDRQTIVCHLRYGAVTSRRMTADALAGRPTSFYPGGRSLERPGTLVPALGERAGDLVSSLAAESAHLRDAWAALSVEQWQAEVREPADNPDLGRITLADLAVSRLTEVEVHGTDLDLGLDDWSEVFIVHALAARIGRLPTRRTNHRPVDPAVQGRWLLRSLDGPCWLLSVSGDRVAASPAEPDAVADACIDGSSRDLLALLLDRPTTRPLSVVGDADLAASFGRAFPGPRVARSCRPVAGLAGHLGDDVDREVLGRGELGVER